MAEAKAGNLLLALGEVTGCLGRVWDDAPGDDGDDYRGKTFDEEEETPRGDGAELTNLYNEPCQRGCEACCERRG
jgi:hypothetical protein